MKRKEFIKKIEELGYEIKQHYAHLDVVSDWSFPYPIVEIGEGYAYVIDTNHAPMLELTVEEREALYGVSNIYAATPIEER